MTIQQKFLISIGFSPMSDDDNCSLYKRKRTIQTSNTSLNVLINTYRKDFECIEDTSLKETFEAEMEKEGKKIPLPKKRGRKKKIDKENEIADNSNVKVMLDDGVKVEIEHDDNLDKMPESLLPAPIYESPDLRLIAEDLPFEDVLIESDQYMYLADFIKSVPLPVLRRISYDGKRFYFEMKESGEVVLYSSGTTLISDGYVDTSGGLDAWRLKQRILGKDPDAIAAERADFGTIMHFVFGCLLMNQRIPFSVGGVKAFIRSHYDDLKIENERIDYIMNKYAVELLEDIRSFLKWVKDYNVKPLAIELMLRSEKYQVASAIDLICEMDYEEKVTGYFGATYQRATGEFKKGDPKLETKVEKKRIVAVVDFKSNRDGNFYPSYALQLELYRRMIRENFGDLIPVERIYNFAPKGGWSDKRNYHFRERTDDRELKKADCVFEQGKINHIFKEPKITYYIGNAGIDDSFDLDSCVRTMKLVDYLQDPLNWNKS